MEGLNFNPSVPLFISHYLFGLGEGQRSCQFFPFVINRRRFRVDSLSKMACTMARVPLLIQDIGPYCRAETPAEHLL